MSISYFMLYYSITLLGLAVLNNINMVVFGERFEIDDEDYKTALKISNGAFESLKNGDPTLILPWLKYLPMKSFKIAEKTLLLRRNFSSKRIFQHERKFNAENNINGVTNTAADVTDHLLAVLQDKVKLQKHDMENMGYDDIEAIGSDVFNGGFETTLTTVGWAILYLLYWPEYQEEIYQEMIKRLGHNKKPTYEDRSVLPILEATVQETLRLSSALLGIPHKAIKDTSVGGKFVRKDTAVVFNFWGNFWS